MHKYRQRLSLNKLSFVLTIMSRVVVRLDLIYRSSLIL